MSTNTQPTEAQIRHKRRQRAYAIALQVAADAGYPTSKKNASPIDEFFDGVERGEITVTAQTSEA